MGDRFTLTVKCKCGFIDNDVWYAPTCGFIDWTCPKCKEITDLEEYSGINAEGCANTKYGVRAVRELQNKDELQEIVRDKIKMIKKKKKRYAVSDIHGNFKALKQVLKESKFDYDKDELIVVGDVCDGYNDSYEVVEEVLKIKNCIFIIGNHDLWFMENMANGWAEDIWLSQGGEATRESYKNNGYYYSKFPKSHKDFFNKGIYWYETEDMKMLFVHGGFNYPKMPWETDKDTLVWDRDLLWRCKCGLRILEWDKVFLGHTQVESTNPKPIIMSEPSSKGAKVIQLDCGAGWKGRLCLFNIDTDEYFLSDFAPRFDRRVGE